MSLESDLLKKDMLNEAKNEMKKIAKDWRKIKENFNHYKDSGLNTQESFYYSLIDCGYLTMNKLQNYQ